jgi:hypothetical protein
VTVDEDDLIAAMFVVGMHPAVIGARRCNPVAVGPDPVPLPDPIAAYPDSGRKGCRGWCLDQHRGRCPTDRDRRWLRKRWLDVDTDGRIGRVVFAWRHINRSRVGRRRIGLSVWRGWGSRRSRHLDHTA